LIGDGFLAWHQLNITKLEHWLVKNGGQKFVPLPYWDPAESTFSVTIKQILQKADYKMLFL